MRLLIIILFCLAFVAPASAGALVQAISAVSCSGPTGDQISDGFETPGYEIGACGSAPCISETGTIDDDYILSGLSGGSGADENCTYGLDIDASGSPVYADYEITSGLSTVYVEFSFYLDSESMSSGQNFTLMRPYATTTTTEFGALTVQDVAGVVKLYVSASANSSLYTIDLDTWYYVSVQFTDNSTGYLTVGTTYDGAEIANSDDFTCYDEAAQGNFIVGVFGSRTARVVIGYFEVDDDGTF